MNKKKRKFTLIEVLIAIFLVSTACFFLLDFEESYIKNARQSLRKVQKERLIQEAYVLLLEQLYTNQIPWKLIQDNKSHTFLLSEENWEAEATFAPVNHRKNELVTQNLMDVKITLILRYKGEVESTQPVIRLCLKKEGSQLVQTPA